MFVCTHREIYFKELAHVIVGLSNPKMPVIVGRLESQERVDIES